MLVQLLGQLLAPQAVSRKHGTNVVTGYGGSVNPDSLAPVRSRYFYNKDAKAADEKEEKMGAAAGAAAAVGGGRYHLRRPRAP